MHGSGRWTDSRTSGRGYIPWSSTLARSIGVRWLHSLPYSESTSFPLSLPPVLSLLSFDNISDVAIPQQLPARRGVHTFAHACFVELCRLNWPVYGRYGSPSIDSYPPNRVLSFVFSGFIFLQVDTPSLTKFFPALTSSSTSINELLPRLIGPTNARKAVGQGRSRVHTPTNPDSPDKLRSRSIGEQRQGRSTDICRCAASIQPRLVLTDGVNDCMVFLPESVFRWSYT